MREWIDLVEDWGNDAILNSARAYQGAIYDIGEPGGGKVEDFNWHVDPHYNINKKIDSLTPQQRVEWMQAEIKAWADEGEPDRFDDMLDEPIVEEIIAVEEKDGATFLWDGNHRVGASLLTGRTTVPAIVGIRH